MPIIGKPMPAPGIFARLPAKANPAPAIFARPSAKANPAPAKTFSASANAFSSPAPSSAFSSPAKTFSSSAPIKIFLFAFLAISFFIQPIFADEPLCDICFRSFLKVNLSDAFSTSDNQYYIRAVVHAYYLNTTITQGAGGGQPNSYVNPEDNPAYSFILANATNASIYIKFDGMDIIDINDDTICAPYFTKTDDVSDPDGIAKKGMMWCEIHYYRDRQGNRRLISDAPSCGMLTVYLNHSYDEPRVKPSMVSAILCPPKANGVQSLWPILGPWITNPAIYFSCIGGFIALGVLIASMYYNGKNPLSLLDITTPRLPQGRKARMPKATLPYHLAHKARINDRVIARAEKAIITQLVAMYRRGGVRNTTELVREAKKAFAQSGADRAKLLATLRLLAEQSGMRPDHVNAMMRGTTGKGGIFERLVDIRVAADIDKQRFSAARGGGPATGPIGKHLFKGVRNWPAKLTAAYGPKFAKPWKFIPGVEGKKWADRLPGLPYVERVSLIAGSWLTSRMGSIAMRRDIRRAAAAELGQKLGMLKKDSPFYEKYSYDKKKIGEIPAIIERMHQETIHKLRAVQDEVLNKLVRALATRRDELKKGDKNNPELVLIEKRLREIHFIRSKIDAEYKAAVDKGLDYSWHERVMHELLAYAKKERLIDYKIGPDGQIIVLNNRLFFTHGNEAEAKADGLFKRRAMTKAEVEYLLNRLVLSQQIIMEAASIRKGTLTKDGNDPIFFDANGKPIALDPEKVRERYVRSFSLLEEDHKRWRNGLIPFTPLSVDLAEYSGRMLLRTDAAFRSSNNEAYRMMRIRLRMEEEVAFKKLYEILMRGRSEREGQEVYGFKLGENAWRDLMNRIYKETSPEGREGIRGSLGPLSYTARSEFAARKFITGYSANLFGFELEAERGKVESLRQSFANMYGKNWENLFRNYDLNHRRNLDIYDTMKATHEVIMGKFDWGWGTYLKWRERGVLFEDAKKGIWIIGADKTVRPMSGLDIENWRRTGKFEYNKDIAYQMLSSDYSERPINATLLSKGADGLFHHGAPLKDPEVRRIIYNLMNAQSELFNPRTSEGGLDATAEGRRRRQMLEANLQTLTELMKDKIRWASRVEAAHHGGIVSRAGNSFAMMLEKVFGGGTYNTAERLQQWYATQAHTRVVLENFAPFDDSPIWDKGKRPNTWTEFLSEETKESLAAKRNLAKAREDQLALLQKTTLMPTEQLQLSQLRLQISQLQASIPELEARARLSDRALGGADRSMRELADMSIPFYNTNEMTVMRDPRIAFGGGYGMKPAIMVGYQTGQFVGERSNMWAGANLVPADRVLNQLAKPAFVAAMMFGSHTRSFFTKMMGYTTMYQQTEHGPENERFAFRHAFTTLFRPTESFDWLTRLMSRPIWRKPSMYRDEFGYTIKEEHGGTGARFIMPFTWKGGGVDPIYRADASRMQLEGISGGVEAETRRRKLGMTFREWFNLTDSRTASENPQAAFDQLRSTMQLTADSREKAMIQSQMEELQEKIHAERKIWRIPIIGKFFQQGYYSVEDRAGYDISAMGGAHRPWELLSPYHKNIGLAPIPGMVYKTWDNELKLFPRVASMLINAPQDYGSYDNSIGVWRNKDIDSRGAMRKLLGLGMVGGERTESISGNLGRDALFKESLKDVYRHEKNLLYQFMEIETEHMQYNFLNNYYVMPLAPPIAAVYQILKSLPFYNNPLRNWGATTLNKYEKYLTPEEAQSDQARMRSEMNSAAFKTPAGQQSYWTCSRHGVSMPYGVWCMICQTEQEDIQNRQKKVAGLTRMKYGMRDTAISYLGSFLPFEYKPDPDNPNTGKFSPSIRGYTYNYYINQTHCPTHGIGYPRGTNCPMCNKEDFLEARQLTKCPRHGVYFQRGLICWKCSSREPNEQERIADTRPSYLGNDAMEIYKKELARRLSNMREDEKKNELQIRTE